MTNFKRYFILSILLLGVFSSCSEELDFDQIDDIAVTPTLEGPLVYVEAPEDVINLAPAGAIFYEQEINFDAFNKRFFTDKVIDGFIIYEVENTTSKSLDLVVDIVDDMGNTLDTESFSVAPAPTSVLIRQIAYGGGGRNIDILKNSSGIRFSATNLGDNTSVSNIDPRKIILRSSGKFRVELIQ